MLLMLLALLMLLMLKTRDNTIAPPATITTIDHAFTVAPQPNTNRVTSTVTTEVRTGMASRDPTFPTPTVIGKFLKEHETEAKFFVIFLLFVLFFCDFFHFVFTVLNLRNFEFFRSHFA